jgi:bacteriocin biosynthesis cyclodehydratase domain-containing protein
MRCRVTVPFDAVPAVPPERDAERARGHAAAADGWRPALVTALRPVWRDGASVQFGVDPERAVVIDGVDERSVRLLLGLDGGRTDGEVLSAARAAGLDPPAVAALLDDLHDAGVLADARPTRSSPAAADPARPPVEAAAGPAVRPTRRPRSSRRAGPVRLPASVAGRLAPDHASLSLLAGGVGAHAGAADEVLDRRRAAAVVVHGGGRVGTTLAALVAAAGVGHVHVVDRGAVRPADLAPGGLTVADLHRLRGSAAADVVRRGAPEAQTRPLAPGRPPDVVLLASARPVDTDLTAMLHRAALPHLVVGVRETTAVVGPLVLPGRTSCLRCADLHRSDRDPAWPMLAAQLSGRPPPTQPEPCDVALAALAAALGALQCLTYLDGEAATCRGGTLEFALPGGRLRRRSWPAHPRCDCGAADATSGAAAARGEWFP